MIMYGYLWICHASGCFTGSIQWTRIIDRNDDSFKHVSERVIETYA